jgi:hypothetical protein
MMTRARLESLSTGELLRLADREGIDIPPDADRVSVIHELLECAGTEKAPPPPEQEKKKGAEGPAPLPQRYNLTCLEVLVRDPLWVFAFWEIRDGIRKKYEDSPDFGGYFLRVRGVPRKGESAPSDWTVAVARGDHGRYLGFPPTGGAYVVELGAKMKTPEMFASSEVFDMPSLPEPGSFAGAKSGLYALSDAESFFSLRLDETSSLSVL